MSEYIKVTCPEHEQQEIIQVVNEEIRWCSRVAGRPVCAGTCLKKSPQADTATEYGELSA